MTRLGAEHPALRRLNSDVFSDPRVRVVNQDAMVWFSEHRGQFDVILLDFPDPSNYAISKLYSTHFYRTVRDRLQSGGAVSVQATSPLMARKAFWCIVRTLESVGLRSLPYHVFVPSFGEWGFVLARHEQPRPPAKLPSLPLRYLDSDSLRAMFRLSPDLGKVETDVNRLNNQALVGYYLDDWSRYD
jgi:spermidine synthase